MKYSTGQNLADYGFGFYEKLHQPIFLMSKLGEIVKMNEAGRKLMRIVQINKNEFIKAVTKKFILNLETKATGRIWVKSKNLGLQLIASELKDSDYFLIEVQR